MLAWQLRLAVKRRETKAAFLLTLAFAVLAFGISVADALASGNDSSTVLPAYASFMLHSSIVNPVSIIYLMLLPLAAALPFSDSWLIERSQNISCPLLTRCRKVDYIWSKAGACIILGALVSALPAALNLVWCMLAFPAQGPRNVIGSISSLPIYDYFWQHVYLNSLYAAQPYIYAWLCVLHVGMYGAVCALMAFALSLYLSKHRVLVICMPFLIVNLASVVQLGINVLSGAGVQFAQFSTYFAMAEDSIKFPLPVHLLIWALLAALSALAIAFRTRDADIL